MSVTYQTSRDIQPKKTTTTSHQSPVLRKTIVNLDHFKKTLSVLTSPSCIPRQLHLFGASNFWSPKSKKASKKSNGYTSPTIQGEATPTSPTAWLQRMVSTFWSWSLRRGWMGEMLGANGIYLGRSDRSQVDPIHQGVLDEKMGPLMFFWGLGWKLQDGHVGCMAYFYVILRGFSGKKSCMTSGWFHMTNEPW